MEKDAAVLREKIARLPQHEPRHLSANLGYHSDVGGAASDRDSTSHQITLSYRHPPSVEAVALVPALVPWAPTGKVFAFPKRFMIETRGTDSSDFETVVNWMDTDFPDPGPYPVFFSGMLRPIYQLRLTVPREAGDDDQTFFALDEIFLFRPGFGGRLGENVGSWVGRTVEATDSFSMPPVWNLKYVVDGNICLGVPLSDETFDKPDLLILPDTSEILEQTVEIVIDFGEVVKVGRIDLWQAGAEGVPALAFMGLPGAISAQISESGKFDEPAPWIRKPSNRPTKRARGRVVSVYGQTQPCRKLKITLSDLPKFKGKRMLGLGEIAVTRDDRLISQGAQISANGIPEKYKNQLARLVDGCSQQRKILPQGEWIKGLAIRRSLDGKLAVLESQLATARADWRNEQRRLWIYCAIGVIGILCWGIFHQRMRRRRSVTQLKERIARDLHDDVGSSLGSITLSVERLGTDLAESPLREDIADLSLLSREASASLRDVVWVIDRENVLLLDLVKQMEERARRVLNDMDLEFSMSVEIPEGLVTLDSKRQLMMFFKEAIHNCARHSGAKSVQICVEAEEERFRISITDDGCGFDGERVADGWGLKTMRNRAVELHGEIEISSRVGNGTQLIFKVPLASLFQGGDWGYKTSN